MIFVDGFSGYTDTELDELIKKAKSLGCKVNDRRKWWNRFSRKKPKHPIGIWYNVKTQQYEKGK